MTDKDDRSSRLGPEAAEEDLEEEEREEEEELDEDDEDDDEDRQPSPSNGNLPAKAPDRSVAGKSEKEEKTKGRNRSKVPDAFGKAIHTIVDKARTAQEGAEAFGTILGSFDGFDERMRVREQDAADRKSRNREVRLQMALRAAEKRLEFAERQAELVLKYKERDPDAIDLRKENSLQRFLRASLIPLSILCMTGGAICVYFGERALAAVFLCLAVFCVVMISSHGSKSNVNVEDNLKVLESAGKTVGSFFRELLRSGEPDRDRLENALPEGRKRADKKSGGEGD